MKTIDFLHGQMDCIAGIPAKLHMSKDYDRGYEAQLSLEQSKKELGIR